MAASKLSEQVKAAGVVGAGGGGFPTHIKLAAQAEFVIANGAECEPLLHKDAAVMQHFAADVVRGVELSMQSVGARQGVIGIKYWTGVDVDPAVMQAELARIFDA